MCMYDELLKKFNLLIGEIFKYEGTSYVVTRDGVFNYDNLTVDGKLYERADNLMLDMLLGNISRVKCYRPELHEVYYHPDISSVDLYKTREWLGEPLDITLWERCMVFQTEQEAIVAAKQMLSVLECT